MLIPALVAGIGLLWAWRPGPGPDADRRARALGAPLLAAAFLAGYALLVGPPPLPGPERTLSAEQWLAWLVLAAALVLPSGEALARRAALLAELPSLGLAALLVERVTRAKLAHAWRDAAAAQLAAVALPLVLLWLSGAALARRRPGPGVPASLCLALSCFAPAALLAGSGLLAQLAGSLAAALGAAAVAALLRPALSFAGGAASLAVLAGFGLGLCSRLYAGLALGPALCFAVAPLSAWSAEWLPCRERALPRELARLVAVLLVAGAGLVWAWLLHEPDPYAY